MGTKSFLLLSLILLASCHRVVVREAEFLQNESRHIIGGENASTKEFPFIVNIWQNSPKDSFVDHLCGGSLVAKNWVLTAAHCVLEDVTDKTVGTVKVAELSLFVGSDLISGEGGREYKVKSIVVHPDFSWPKHDIALVELTEDVADVAPIAMNTKKDLGASQAGLVATVAGWGLTDSQGRVDGKNLQKVSVPLISRTQCGQDWFPQKRGWNIESDMLCASSAGDTKSACPGDSGGPLVVSENGVATLIGVVSWGNACRGADVLHRSNVEGYADVADALSWIQKTINKR